MADPVRWGVIGTANIAARSFLPALREAGGRAVVAGSRSAGRATAWAEENQVESGGSYADVVAAALDAVYVALPNEQHAEWAAAAATTARAVLCEKPLTLDADATAALLAAAGPQTLLWESFVFPFHPQTELLQSLIAAGDLGEPREIVSEFHFTVGRPDNIRLRPEHGGGALYDVGCYPVRLARLLFGAEPVAASASALPGPTGVDLDTAGVLDFPSDKRLVFSAGLRRPYSTATRVVGTEGELRVGNPFHPQTTDTVELWSGGALKQTWPAGEGTAFRHAVQHIHRVLRDGEAPRHLATVDALPQARAIDLIRESLR
ncbi:MAG: Gfo/Idh/MocA family oxidoreductase [Actinoplanes sp.]